jgi:hypothetical protein
MGALLFAAIILVTVFMFVRWLTRANPAALAGAVRRAAWIGGVVGVIGLLGLILTRNPGFLAGLLFFLAPLLVQLVQRWQAARSLGRGWGRTEDGNSTVSTAFLAMTLEHASGEMQGRVLQGRFAGRQLADLGEGELTALLAECAADADSARLLESYLERRLGPGWRQRAGGRTGERGSTRNTDMTVDEAWQVLGLAPGATPEEIRAAHRRLMQTVHPDRGGTDYLAARVNRAKDLLLNE